MRMCEDDADNAWLPSSALLLRLEHLQFSSGSLLCPEVDAKDSELGMVGGARHDVRHPLAPPWEDADWGGNMERAFGCDYNCDHEGASMEGSLFGANPAHIIR